MNQPKVRMDGPRRSSLRVKNLRVDLAGCAPMYLKHLDAWDVLVSTDDESLIRRAIRRYERFWLTLLYQQQDGNELEVTSVPPTDVHWIWHLHMLLPSDYYVYCKQRFGRILPHRFLRTESEAHVTRLKTAASWRKAFPNEPFELDLKEVENPGNFQPGNRLDYLVDLAKRDKSFKHRVALAHFRDQNFHFAAESRYRQLLSLRQCYDWEPRCLPTDVELVWRVHMLHPLHYVEDIKQFVAPSDGSASPFSIRSFLSSGVDYLERLPCSELTTFISVSNHFWRSVYPSDEHVFFVDGTTPRTTGEKSKPILVAFRSQDYEGHVVESCDITFTSLSVEELWTKQKNFKVSVKVLGVNSFKQEPIFEAKGVLGQVVTQPDKKFRIQGVKDQGFLGKCRFDPRENRGVEVQVFACLGFGCFVKHRLMTTKVFDPLQTIALTSSSHGVASISLGQSSLKESKSAFLSSDNINKRQQIVIPKITCTDPKMILNYRVEVSNRRPFQFVLDRNPGDLSSLPVHLESLLSGIINWQEAMTDVDNGTNFVVARHSLKCRDLGLAFGVEIVRNDFYNLFAVSLFHNNQHLVMTAYSIDQHYLANSFQVTGSCPLVLNPLRGDLAMVLRSAEGGEEQILVSKWVEGNDNAVHVTTYDTKTRHSYTIQMAEDEQHSFSNDAVTVELPSGRITAVCTAGKVPASVAWAFSVGCLYISTQRPSTSQAIKDSTSVISLPSGDGSGRSNSAQFSLDGSSESASIGKKHKKRSSLLQYRHNKKMHRRRKMSASFTFLLACGFRVEITSTTSPDSSVTTRNSSRFDHSSTVDVATFSRRTSDSQPHTMPETNVHLRMSTRSSNAGPSDNSKFYESRFDCDQIETSIFERM